MNAIHVNPNAVMPHLKIRSGDVPARMLVVGDPARAERTAALLDGATELSRNREYVMFAGSWKGERVGVASHGVGTAGAGICFEELCRSGVRRIIRAGTAGGMQPDIPEGSLIIATGAVREKWLTRGSPSADATTLGPGPPGSPGMTMPSMSAAVSPASRTAAVAAWIALASGVRSDDREKPVLPIPATATRSFSGLRPEWRVASGLTPRSRRCGGTPGGARRCARSSRG